MKKKPYPVFNRQKLTLKPLSERVHDLDAGKFLTLDSPLPLYDNQKLKSLCMDIKLAKKQQAPVILAMGAHVIRSGAACYIIELLKKRVIDHICFNGACAIHDYEIALAGATTESVPRYIKTGEFGMWKETGLINDYIKKGRRFKYGFGQSLGYAISKNNLPFKEKSILYQAYELEIPVTVHAGIGYDIIHQHPNCDGAVLGEASYRDFLIFARTIERLQKGVYISAGTAVMGPEIFLKALCMARNVHHNIDHITTAVFDLVPINDKEAGVQPEKSDYRYYFRPWKTLLVRTVSGTGKSYYIQGHHEQIFPHFYKLLMEGEV